MPEHVDLDPVTSDVEPIGSTQRSFLAPEAVRLHEASLRSARDAEDKRFFGAEAVLETNPFDAPKRPKHSPRPYCHASDPLGRAIWFAAYRAICAAFLVASALFRSGERETPFPAWTYPPALPLTLPDQPPVLDTG